MATAPSTPSANPLLREEEGRLTPQSSKKLDFASPATPAGASVPLTPGQHKSQGSGGASAARNVTADLAFVVLLGTVFGWLLSKAGVYRADVMRTQFNFNSFPMLMMFLSAASSSIIAVAFLYSMGWGTEVRTAAKKHYDSPTMGLPGVMLGTAMVGVGMAVSGTCPGTIWAGLGAGMLPKTLTTLAGGVVGAALHAAFYPLFEPLLRVGSLKMRTAYELFGLSRWVTGLAFVCVMLGVALALQFTVYTPLPSTGDGFFLSYWNPILTGSLLGLLQVPMTLGIMKNLGASTSFSVAVSHMLFFIKGNAYIEKNCKADFLAWWQVLFVGCIMLGSFLASLSTGTFYTAAMMREVTYVEAFLGGLIGIGGARIAGACTSGHGITGVGHQAVHSLVGTGCMMAAAFAVGLIFFADNDSVAAP